MSTPTIGVVGGGTVGKATARTYLEYTEVRLYDVVPERSSHSLSSVMECDIVFVCLPTPESQIGFGADLSILESFVKTCGDHPRTTLVLKSTLPVGTTRKLSERYKLYNLVHSPEFLTSRCANTDAMLPARNIVGGSMSTHTHTLVELYKSRFPGTPVHVMTSDESEAVKLICNSFFAVKVAFFNEVRTLADDMFLDWDRVLGAVLADGRISHGHTKVPGPDGRMGFGGGCLPKDLSMFIASLTDRGLSAAVSGAAYERNIKDRKR